MRRARGGRKIKINPDVLKRVAMAKETENKYETGKKGINFERSIN